MSEWLSAEWFEEVRPLWPELPQLEPRVSARLQVDVTGGPQRVVAVHMDIDDGRVVDGGPGPAQDPDLSLTLAWDDALGIQQATTDPNVAFMQGRLKVTGSMAVMLSLLAAARSEEWRAVCRRAAELAST